jgi:hypothetical protein
LRTRRAGHTRHTRGRADLTVNLEKGAELSAAAGGDDAWQIHLGGQGEFPGKFAYRFRTQGSLPAMRCSCIVTTKKPASWREVQRATVDADGNVTFEFYHGGAYFVSGEIIDTAMNHFAAIETTANATPVETPVAAPALLGRRRFFAQRRRRWRRP